jgi:hypothetical protein
MTYYVYIKVKQKALPILKMACRLEYHFGCWYPREGLRPGISCQTNPIPHLAAIIVSTREMSSTHSQETNTKKAIELIEQKNVHEHTAPTGGNL